MTGRQQPRPGDIAVSAADRAKIINLHGAAVGMRAAESSPTLLARADLSNVVPFARVRRPDTERETPALEIDDAARPAPPSPHRKARARLIAFAACSLAAHVALSLALVQEPKALASVGIETINVEIVLGANTLAGLTADQGENHVQAPAHVQQTQEQPAEEKTASQVPPQEQPAATASAIPAPEQPKQPEQPVAELPAPPKPKQTVERAPERKRVTARTSDKATDDRRSTQSAPSSAASGIGRGRSDADTNYRGLVAAHLARHKQYPAEARARNEQGSATLTFTLDGSGRVTSARLVRGSGSASLDQEAQAIARRASPFPAPPNGRPARFTVPVSFGLR